MKANNVNMENKDTSGEKAIKKSWPGYVYIKILLIIFVTALLS